MDEVQPDVVEKLSKMALFKGLDTDQIQRIAARFDPYELQEGGRLFSQGDRGDSFYILLSGRVRVFRQTKDQSHDLAVLGNGDYIGEESLLYGQRRSASVEALQDTRVLRLDKEGFKWVLREYPQIRLFLAATIETRRLARSKRYGWLSDDETIYLMARKHPADLYLSLVAPLLVGWAAVFFFFLAYKIDYASLSVVFEWAGGIVLLAAVLWSIWIYIDWGNDFYIVTNQRVVWLERVVGIYDSRQEAPLSTVLTVVVQTDQLGRLTGYGNVVVRTFTGQIVMPHVGYPNQLAGLIEEQLSRTRQSVQKAETEALEQAIRVRLGLSVEDQPKKQPVPAPRTKRRKPGGLPRMLTDFFKIRIEESGVVTFRKHWILLLDGIWKQTLIIFLLLGLIAARLTGYIDIFSVPMILLTGITFLLIAFVWWLYEYIDWRNDIYQLSSEQIIDIYRKPLGKEDKKTAVLENILSLQHQRKGILGLVLNYGDVIAMVGGTRFTFDGVYDPASVEQEIFHRINQRKRALKDADAAREREQIADWLAAYHRQMENLKDGENQPKARRKSE